MALMIDLFQHKQRHQWHQVKQQKQSQDYGLGIAKQTIADRLTNTQQEDVTTYITPTSPKEPTETKMQSNYQELLTDEIEAQGSPQIIPAYEEPVIQ